MHWLCEICGYVHDGDEAPENCIICGAPKTKFVEYKEDSEA